MKSCMQNCAPSVAKHYMYALLHEVTRGAESSNVVSHVRAGIWFFRARFVYIFCAAVGAFAADDSAGSRTGDAAGGSPMLANVGLDRRVEDDSLTCVEPSVSAVLRDA